MAVTATYCSRLAIAANLHPQRQEFGSGYSTTTSYRGFHATILRPSSITQPDPERQ
jgi:hypothetical protein